MRLWLADRQPPSVPTSRLPVRIGRGSIEHVDGYAPDMLPRLAVVPVAVVALLSACSSSSSSAPTSAGAASTAAATSSVATVVTVVTVSSASSSATPTSAAVSTPGADEGATTTADSAASSDPGCDVSEAVQDALASDAVQDVSVDAQCTSVDIATSLASNKGKVAIALCNAAAPTAYAGAISAINVEGANGNILASGTKSNGVVVPCATNG